MLPTTTTPAMPMANAARLPIAPEDLIPPLRGAAPAMPAAAAPGPGGTPLGAFPMPSAPVEPPYTIDMQHDGSAIWSTKTDPPVVIGVVPAPKMPVSMQPKA